MNRSNVCVKFNTDPDSNANYRECYTSIEDLIWVGLPIDDEGEDMGPSDDFLYYNHGNGDYKLIEE